MGGLKKCTICGKPVKRSCRTYCSAACHGIARRKRIAVVCAACARPFEIRPYEAERARRHFCKPCRSLWMERSTVTKTPTGYTLPCFFCGAPVYRPKWRSRRYVYTFCSAECRRDGWSTLRLAWEALNWTGQDAWPSTVEEHTQ